MIHYLCPKCGEPLAVADDHAGGRYVCPLCAEATIVPGQIKAPAPPAETSKHEPQQYATLGKDRSAETMARRGTADRAVRVAILAFLLPFIGIALGLLRAFDQDPERRAQAGAWFCWSWLGLVTPFVLYVGFNTVMVIGFFPKFVNFVRDLGFQW